MKEFNEVKALLNAFEKLVDKHPYLSDELQSIYQEELLQLRVKSLKKQLSVKS